MYTGRREGRLITIAARKTGARATLLFSDKNTLSFEDVLKDFGNTLGLEKVETMSTPSGRQVSEEIFLINLIMIRTPFRKRGLEEGVPHLQYFLTFSTTPLTMINLC